MKSNHLHTWTESHIHTASIRELAEAFGDYVGHPSRLSTLGPYRNACKRFLRGFKTGLTYHANQKPTNHKVLTSGAKFAFKCGGVDYYEPTNVEELPPKRYAEWLVKFEELRMGVDRQFLEALAEGWEGSYEVQVPDGKTKGALKLTEAYRWLYELKARMQIVPNPNYAYTLASVHFFTLDEDLTTYDPEEAKAKISHWESNSESLGFFLNEPVKNLIGLGTFSEDDLRKSLRANLIRWNFLEEALRNTSRGDTTKSTSDSEDTHTE